MKEVLVIESATHFISFRSVLSISVLFKLIKNAQKLLISSGCPIQGSMKAAWLYEFGLNIINGGVSEVLHNYKHKSDISLNTNNLNIPTKLFNLLEKLTNKLTRIGQRVSKIVLITFANKNNTKYLLPYWFISFSWMPNDAWTFTKVPIGNHSPQLVRCVRLVVTLQD